MKNQWLAIKQIDEQLKEFRAIHKKYIRPRSGWIKTLRVALSMTAEQFAHRLGVTRGRVNQLETAEVDNAVTLRTLEEAANALGCELVYAIIPKDGATLEDIIKSRAELIAKERVANVSHSMSLEDQSVDSKARKSQEELLVKNLMEHLNKKFWATSDNDKSSQKLFKNFKKKK